MALGSPASLGGFYTRQVENLALENVRLSTEKDDRHPVLVAEAVGKLKLDDFRFPRAPDAAEPLALDNVKEGVK